jgi:HK97 family phage major capsid protein
MSMKHEPKAFEIKSGDDDDPVAVVTKSLGDLQTSVDERLAQIEAKADTTKLTERLDKLEAKAQRPGGDGAPDQVSEERKAFTGYLRGGREALQADEVKALTTADDTSGGYLAPAEFSTEVIKGIVEISPVRQAARVGSTSSGSVILPKRTGTPTARWVGEDETRTPTGSTYGQIEVPIHEMAVYVDVSLKLIEDAAISVESEVAMDLSQEFGRLEAKTLLTGDGAKKPLGIMQASGVDFTPTGNASTLGSAPADLLIDHMYSMPATYRQRGVWMMNGTTLATIRKLKDGDGRFLWQPSYAAGQPETILGRPVVEAVDMDDIGSAAEPIVFGDFSSAYRIYDRVGLSIMRDPYSQAAQGLVRFHARRRLGGGMVLGEAIKKIRCATS